MSDVFRRKMVLLRLPVNLGTALKVVKKSKSESETKRKGLSKGQKAAIALVAAGLAAYGGYKLAQSGKLDGFINRGSKALSGMDTDRGAGGVNQTVLSKFGLLPEDHDPANSVHEVNLYHGGSNCGGVSVSLLERINNNLNIVAKDHGRMTWDDLKEVYPGLKPNPIGPLEDPRELSSYIGKHFSDGDNGILRLNSRNSAAACDHYITWAKENGRVMFMDGQPTYTVKGKTVTGIAYDDNPRFDFLYAPYDLYSCQIAQVNNLTMTDNEQVLDKYFERGKD